MMVAAEAWLAGLGAPKVQLMVRTPTPTDTATATAAAIATTAPGVPEGLAAFYGSLGYVPQATTVLGRRLDEDLGPGRADA